ncbi:MAG: hypothetical protein WAS27_00120 [Candidatus Saccharimonadales bacterium]
MSHELTKYIQGTHETFAHVRHTLAKGALETSGVHRPKDKRAAFAQSASILRHELPPHHEEQKYLSIISTMPAMVQSLANLHGEGRRSHDARLSAVHYNNSLREILDLNPKILPAEIQTMVKSTAARFSYDASTINTLCQETSTSLRGMQHELAFEAALYYLPEDYEIIETTDEDDLQGTDFKVKAPNGTIVRIDVKASEQTALHANQKQEIYYQTRGKHRPANEIIMYSGFYDEDFLSDNPWRATPQAIEAVTPYIQESIDIAAGYRHPAQRYAAV